MGRDAHGSVQAPSSKGDELLLLLEAALFKRALRFRREGAWAHSEAPATLTEAALAIHAPYQGHLRLRCEGASAAGLGAAAGAKALLGPLMEELAQGAPSAEAWAWEALMFPLSLVELGPPLRSRRLRIAAGWLDLDYWPLPSVAVVKDEA